MSAWQQLKHALTRDHGFSADGRRIGIGLAAAREAERRNTVTDIEDFLDRRDQDKTTV
ncbi:hypothetical protein [Saccharothrix sp.]|uniref:hypothetical protein n=1 Tax=Saccharothrix sp. TaxID=1873460 RepID=UPI0028121753|nr:hypothetical protein [Saccharothrix sp.]